MLRLTKSQCVTNKAISPVDQLITGEHEGLVGHSAELGTMPNHCSLMFLCDELISRFKSRVCVLTTAARLRFAHLQSACGITAGRSLTCLSHRSLVCLVAITHTFAKRLCCDKESTHMSSTLMSFSCSATNCSAAPFPRLVVSLYDSTCMQDENSKDVTHKT